MGLLDTTAGFSLRSSDDDSNEIIVRPSGITLSPGTTGTRAREQIRLLVRWNLAQMHLPYDQARKKILIVVASLEVARLGNIFHVA